MKGLRTNRSALIAACAGSLVMACSSNGVRVRGDAPGARADGTSAEKAPADLHEADAGSRSEATAGERPRGASSDAREDKLIAKALTDVSRVRALAPMHAVPGRVLARDQLLARVKEHVAREVPPAAIKREGLILQIFGMVPQKFDYESETFKLLQAQLAGFYEPTDGTMYMAGDLDEANADATLAHELVHALQDQHYDLKPHSKYVPGDSDRQSAFSALAEGDATSAMADVLVGRSIKGKTALDLPDDAFVESVMASVSGGPTADTPHIMRTSLVSPYVVGTLFVNALRRSGGWSAVDAAWRDLPSTTEQILHVEKWRAHEPAAKVTAPTFAALGAGWHVVDEDTYGELGLRLAFEEWIGAEHSVEASAGWGGDRGVLLERDGEAALAIRTRFDHADTAPDDGFARRAFTQIARGIEGTVGKASAKEPAFLCIERAGLGPLTISRKDRELVITAGPVKMGGEGWRSGGSCALARKWVSEIGTMTREP